VTNRIAGLSFVFMIAACSPGEQDKTLATADAPTGSPTASGKQSGDSSMHDTTAMTGMDHSNMPGMAGTAATPAADPMAGMDHSRMDMPARTGATTTQPRDAMAGMDHSQMTASGATAQPAGVDHSAMPGMASAASPADTKLQQIIARLLTDPVVIGRIQADSVLRNRWQDPAVRRLVGN